MSDLSLSIDPAVLNDLVPPATLAEARTFREDLSALLRRERTAAADFLVALADFDRRRGWERLGHANLFAFLTMEFGLSNGAAHLRLTAARLLPRHPEVEVALRDGRLCLSAVGELARVITAENRDEVLPRFFRCSAREAREVAAALAPRAVVPRREVVTAVAQAASLAPSPVVAPTPLQPEAADPRPASLRAHEVTAVPVSRAAPRTEVEPLDADLRRLHVTVSRRLLDKVEQARRASRTPSLARPWSRCSRWRSICYWSARRGRRRS